MVDVRRVMHIETTTMVHHTSIVRIEDHPDILDDPKGNFVWALGRFMAADSIPENVYVDDVVVEYGVMHFSLDMDRDIFIPEIRGLATHVRMSQSWPV